MSWTLCTSSWWNWRLTPATMNMKMETGWDESKKEYAEKRKTEKQIPSYLDSNSLSSGDTVRAKLDSFNYIKLYWSTRPTHTAGSDHYFLTYFSILFKISKQISSEDCDRYLAELWVWPSGSLMARNDVDRGTLTARNKGKNLDAERATVTFFPFYEKKNLDTTYPSFRIAK